jgi:cytidine deaminase
MASVESQALENAIEQLPPLVRDGARDVLAGATTISAETLRTWVDELRLAPPELMTLLLPIATAFSRSPVSHFGVGAIAMGAPAGGVPGDIGHLYFGASYEFPDQPLSFGVHAEQAALNNAWLSGESGLQALASSAAPCGYCRQFLYEAVEPSDDLDVIFPRSDGTHCEYTLTALLPERFGPADLQVPNRLMSQPPSLPGGETLTDVDSELLRQAHSSYAPYSGCHSAVAIVRPGGDFVIGRYAENAAFNPSLSAYESAISQLNLTQAAGSRLCAIECILIEVQSDISFVEMTATMTQSSFPGCRYRYRRYAPEVW